MKEISRIEVDDGLYNAVELARCSVRGPRGNVIRVSRAEWLRAAIRAQLAAQGIKVK